MCLITEQKYAKTLKEDLIVKKMVWEIIGNVATSYFYMKFRYNIGKLYKTKMVKSKFSSQYFGRDVLLKYPDWEQGDYTHIYEGFHSMQMDRDETFNGKQTWVKCLIPKGSKVFYDKTGLIASNQIIILSELT